MQIGRKMTELEAFEVLSVILEHPVYIYTVTCLHVAHVRYIYISVYKYIDTYRILLYRVFVK